MLITGAGGEIGHGLIARLAGPSRSIITLDVAPLDKTLAPLVTREFTGSITDADLLNRLLAEFEVDLVFHLAALLSTRAEFTPTTAHPVNGEGTLNLLEFAQRQGESNGRHVVFVYPSSVDAYGMPDLAAKARAGRVREDDFLNPTTMYGCNKLYCEQLGRYYARASTSSSRGGCRVEARGLSLRAVPGIDFSRDRAVRRVVRLRAGDDSRCRARRAVRVLRAAGHDDSIHGHA